MKRTPLHRTASLRRSARLRPRNAKRRARHFAEHFHSAERVSFVRQLCCVACLSWGPCENHHHKSRGAAGAATDIVPLCRDCHGEWHRIGKASFLERWGLTVEDLERYAAHTDELWQKHAGQRPAPERIPEDG